MGSAASYIGIFNIPSALIKLTVRRLAIYKSGKPCAVSYSIAVSGYFCRNVRPCRIPEIQYLRSTRYPISVRTVIKIAENTCMKLYAVLINLAVYSFSASR